MSPQTKTTNLLCLRFCMQRKHPKLLGIVLRMLAQEAGGASAVDAGPLSHLLSFSLSFASILSSAIAKQSAGRSITLIQILPFLSI